MTTYRVHEIKVVGSPHPAGGWVAGELGWEVNGRWPEGHWLLSCPSCGCLGFLNHKVTVVDGRATLEPSVQCPECGAHYYVRDGKIIE